MNRTHQLEADSSPDTKILRFIAGIFVYTLQPTPVALDPHTEINECNLHAPCVRVGGGHEILNIVPQSKSDQCAACGLN